MSRRETGFRMSNISIPSPDSTFRLHCQDTQIAFAWEGELYPLFLRLGGSPYIPLSHFVNADAVPLSYERTTPTIIKIKPKMGSRLHFCVSCAVNSAEPSVTLAGDSTSGEGSRLEKGLGFRGEEK